MTAKLSTLIISIVLTFSVYSQSFNKDVVIKSLKQSINNPEEYYLEQKELKSRLSNYEDILKLTTRTPNLNVASTFDKKEVVKELQSKIKNPEAFYNEQTDIKTKVYNYHLKIDSMSAQYMNNDYAEEVKTNSNSTNNSLNVNNSVANQMNTAVNNVSNSTNSTNNTLNSNKINIESPNNNQYSEKVNTMTNNTTSNTQTINNTTSNTQTINTIKTSSNYNSNLNEEYRVQVGIFPDNSRIIPLENSYNVKSKLYDKNNNFTVYELTNNFTADEAFSKAQEMRQLGYKGAFVTRYVNGMRELRYDYLKQGRNNIQSNNSTKTTNYKSTYSPPAVRSNTNNELTNSNKGMKVNYTAEELRNMMKNSGK